MNKTYEIIAQFTSELADENVKNALLSNPSQFLKERGFIIPPNVQCEFHQNDEQYFYLAIPDSPSLGILSDEELDNMHAAKSGSSSTAGSLGSAYTASTFPGCLGTASSASTVGTASSAHHN